MSRKTSKSFLRNSVALALLAGLTAGGTAYAQDAQPAEEEEEEAIVVTGTRITTEFNSPSPVQVITTESATLQGVADAGEMLQSSSLAAGSPQNDATISSAFVTAGGPGSQTVSLRGLGANRTLVLLNGRRAGPAGARGQVAAFDLNVLPLSITDRVEILKDGASSIYGSDAIAGVINIITRRDMDGAEANLFVSMPTEEGGENIAADVAWGRSFDRGYFNVTAEYNFQGETLLGDRDFTNCTVERTFDPATGARNDNIDVRTGLRTCSGNTLAGQVWVYDYSNEGPFAPGPGLGTGGAILAQYDPTGQLGALVPSTIWPGAAGGQPTVPANFFAVNLNNNRANRGVTNFNNEFEQNSSLVPELERASLYLEGGFELTPHIEVYGEALMNRRESRTNGSRQVWTYLYSTDFGDSLNVGWNGFAILSPTVTTDHFDAEQVVDYTRLVGGMRGDFPGWLGTVNWDIFIQHSDSDAAYTQDVILADAVYSSDGRSDFGTFGLFNANSIPRAGVSCVGFNTPISNRPCVDVNWVSPTLINSGGFSAAEEAFLYDRETGHTKYTQQTIEGSLAGDLFTLPAGNVGAALGFSLRTDEINDTPGPVTLASNSWGLSSAGITAGKDEAREVFGELLIPLLSGSPLAESLDLSVSGRYTDVDSYGSNSTYKAGLNWQITDQFRVRATQGTSFRAPALFELFLAGQTSFARQTIDPCVDWTVQLGLGNITQEIADNCAADGVPGNHSAAGSSATVTTGGGGPGLLKAETSEARGIGFVWEPQFMDLSVAVDYFEIEVSDEVSTLGPAAIVFLCYTSDTHATDPLCSLFTRGGNGGDNFLLNQINDSYLNVNSQTNRGIDLTVSYNHEFPWGDLTVLSQVTYQLEDTIAFFAGNGTDSNGDNGDPQFVGNVNFRLDRDDWTFNWGMNIIGPSSDDDDVVTSAPAGAVSGNPARLFDVDAETTVYHSVSVRRRFDDWAILAGIANLSGEEPPGVTSVGAAQQSLFGSSLAASQYDYIGRRAFVRLSRSF
ncbi:MAG: TonB-dependent receptor [Terricaulis sp.]